MRFILTLQGCQNLIYEHIHFESKVRSRDSAFIKNKLLIITELYQVMPTGILFSLLISDNK